VTKHQQITENVENIQEFEHEDIPRTIRLPGDLKRNFELGPSSIQGFHPYDPEDHTVCD
jgi:hypothetical protein